MVWKSYKWKFPTFGGGQLRTDKDVNRKGAKEFTKVGNELFNLFDNSDNPMALDVYEKAVVMALASQIYRYHLTHISAKRVEVAVSAGISVRKLPGVLDSLQAKGVISVTGGYDGTYIFRFCHLPDGSKGPNEDFLERYPEYRTGAQRAD